HRALVARREGFGRGRAVREPVLGVRDEAREPRLEPHEDAEERDVLDLAGRERALAESRLDPVPGIARRDLAEREREALGPRLDLAHPALDRLADGDRRILQGDAGRELRDVDEAV